MNRLMQVLKALVLMTLIVCGAGAFLLELQISSAVKHADQEAAATVGRVNAAIDAVTLTAARSAKLVDDARLTADNVNRAAIDERMYFERDLPGLMDQAHGILANVQTATADVDPLLKETTARIAALEPIETRSADVLSDVHQMVHDPRIGDAVGNLDLASAQLVETSREGNATMASVQAMAADGQEEVHKLTHPKPLVSIADWMLKVVHALGGFF